MPLPRAKKLNLAVRKQVRDEYESKKADFEKQISDIWGVPWTIEIDPLALYPYAEQTGDNATSSFGNTIRLYLEGTIYRFKLHAEQYGQTGIDEVNKIASAHVLTLDVNEEPMTSSQAFAYSDVDLDGDRRVRLLFAPKNFGSNAGSNLDYEHFLKALNAAPAEGSGNGMSFAARTSITQEWDPKYEEVRAELEKIVGHPKGITFDPNFAETYEKLKEESQKKNTNLQKDWEQYLGRWTFRYFETLVSLMGNGTENFNEDDMLKEGFNETVSEGVIAFRIVDKLEYQKEKRYCESVTEDGVLYLQSTAGDWGSNPNETYSTLLEQL